jgi:hypothetical protein
MIYIIRQREGNHNTNCLSSYGIKRSKDIAKTFSQIKHLKIHTCLPKHTYFNPKEYPSTVSHSHSISKYIKPIETASIVCSNLDIPLHFIDNAEELPYSMDGENHLIIWHHQAIPNIMLLYLFTPRFKWDDNNYDGCIILDKYHWEFKANYIKKNKFKEMCMKFVNWVTNLF